MKCSVCVDLVKPSLRSEVTERAVLDFQQSTGALEADGLVSADRIAQVDDTGSTVAELDVDQVASYVMRSFDRNHG
jgi:copper chaperone CopZ